MIFSAGKKVKIIIVIEAHTLIDERGGNLLKIVDRLIEFFDLDFDKMINSVLLVISKGSKEDFTVAAIEKNII
jgi:hypothetical protein